MDDPRKSERMITEADDRLAARIVELGRLADAGAISREAADAGILQLDARREVLAASLEDLRHAGPEAVGENWKVVKAALPGVRFVTALRAFCDTYLARESPGG